MQIVCPKCGTALEVAEVHPGDRIICGGCGTALHVPGEVPMARLVGGADRRMWYVVVLAVAVALGGGGIGLGLYLGRSAPAPAPGPAPGPGTPEQARVESPKPSPAPSPAPSPPSPAPAETQPDYESVLPSVPVITSMPLVGLGRGSGFLIEYEGKLHVVTNRHVVNAAERGFTLSFHDPAGEGLRKALNLPIDRSALTLVHKTADLAMLDVTDYRPEIEGRGIRPLHLADAAHAPKVMEKVWVFGHPVLGAGLAMDNTVTTGTISRIGDVPGHGRCIGVTAAISHGNSGGPVLDAGGRVLGVVSFGLRGLNWGNFALHVDTIRELLTQPDERLSEKDVADLLKTPEELVQAHKEGRRVLTEISAEASRIAGKLGKEGFHPLMWNNGQNVAFFTLDPKASQSRSFAVTDGKRYAVSILAPSGSALKAAIARGEGAEPKDPTEEEAGRLLRVTAKGDGTCEVSVRNEGAEKSLVIILIMEK